MDKLLLGIGVAEFPNVKKITSNWSNYQPDVSKQFVDMLCHVCSLVLIILRIIPLLPDCETVDHSVAALSFLNVEPDILHNLKLELPKYLARVRDTCDNVELLDWWQ